MNEDNKLLKEQIIELINSIDKNGKLLKMIKDFIELSIKRYN